MRPRELKHLSCSLIIPGKRNEKYCRRGGHQTGSRLSPGRLPALGSDNARPAGARRAPRGGPGGPSGRGRAPLPEKPRVACPPGRPAGGGRGPEAGPRHPGPPLAPRCAPRRVAPAPRPAPCLLCRQRAAARQRARSPSEVPRCFLLRLGRGLMSKPGATRAGHGLPGGAGLAVRCLCRRSRPPPLSFSGSCKSPRARCR